MGFYMDLYRKCDFLCKGCIKLYYSRKCREMLGIQKIVSIKEYNATNKKYCDKCESYEWNHTISFKHFPFLWLGWPSRMHIYGSVGPL